MCTRVVLHMHTYTRERVHRARRRDCKDRSAPLPLATSTLRLCRSFWFGIYARFDGKRQRNSDATQDNFWFTASSPELSPAVHRAEIRPLRRIFEMETHPLVLTLRPAVAIAFQQRSFDGTWKEKKMREREREREREGKGRKRTSRVCSEIGCDRKS